MATSAATHAPRAVATVDLDAIAANCAHLAAQLQGDAQLCAVVKADGYGHGMLPAARAALRGGASRLAVVTLEEVQALAGAGFDAQLLVMAPLATHELDAAVQTGAELTVWERSQVDAIAAAAQQAGVEVGLHVKRDTGMGRFGARDDETALDALDATAATDGVRPVAVWTHFATADEDGDDYFAAQLAAFEHFTATARAAHPDLLAHAANSAATLREPRSHFDFVRCGIAIYGLDPFHRDAAAQGLAPALTLRSRVAAVRDFAAGDFAGYGRRFEARANTRVATVAIGYGDGWRRILGGRAEILVGGRRYPQVGTVSMDSVTVDVGAASDIAVGDAVTLIGREGGESISAETVARQAETINYEITCGLTPRTGRAYIGEGAQGGPAGGV